MHLKPTNKTLLIFDLDGTLIDSASDLAKAVNHMLCYLDKKPFDEEQIHHWVGNGALTLVKRALLGKRELDETLDTDYTEKALHIFLDYYRANLCYATKPYPDVLTTLTNLKKKGYTLAIVTNKPYAFVTPILKSLKMDGLFAKILGGDSLAEKKPHPAPLLHVCKTLGIAVEASVMVGDSKNDILAANACKMDSVGVTYGYNYGEDIATYKPDFMIDNFSELNSIL